MKYLLLGICFCFAFSKHPVAQCNSSAKIVSPVAEKPNEVMISVDCKQMVLRWEVSPDRDYELSLYTTEKGEKTKVIISNKYSQSNGFCTAAFPVKVESRISFSIQSISTLTGKKYYSYPFRSKNLVVPYCNNLSNVASSAKSQAQPAINSKQVTGVLYPNPVNSVLTVSMKNSSSYTHTRIRVADVYGRVLLIRYSNQDNTMLNVQSLVSGTYFLHVQDMNGKLVFNGKFIKE